MKYVYFVSHMYGNGTTMTFGNSEVQSTKIIERFSDILDISSSIAKSNNYEAKSNNYDHNPTILYYNLLRIEE